MRRAAWLLLPLACALGSSVVAPNRRIDYGRWRVVVLQSDDFGLEGWVPGPAAAQALPELRQELPLRLAAYAQSTLETAAEVDSLAAFLLRFRDLDGLAPILQANTIVAAVEPSAPQGPSLPPAFGFALRASGVDSGAYARPGLWRAVARAESLGVWRAELHGLTHLDLEWLRRASDAGEALTLRARALGVQAAAGLSRRSELGHDDASRSAAIQAAARDFFQQRFGRAPISVIAPDFRWCAVDEQIWKSSGMRVVQAKSEQIDPSLHPGRASGRLRKRLRAVLERRRAELLHLDRCAQLEPYGDADPAAVQGADAAAQQIQRAWRRGEPAVVGMHRLQWLHPDAAFPSAMRRQFAALWASLEASGGSRYLVDAEIEQLERRGWSLLPRGSIWVLRNFTPRSLRASLPDREQAVTLRPGTTLLPRLPAP